MKLKKYYERLMLLTGLFVQIVGFIISIKIEDFSNSIIPYASTVVPIINAAGISLGTFMLIFPQFKFLQSLSFFTFGILMTLNSLVFLGVVLYSIGLELMFANKFLEHDCRKRLIIICVPWSISLLTLIPYNLYQFLMGTSYTLFLIFAHAHIYITVRKSIFSLFSVSAKNISTKQLPEIGSNLNLKTYGLTERQIKIVKEFSKKRSTYKEIADCIFTSESTIKHEMGDIFPKLGVQNISELSFLLSQYKLS